MPMDASGELQSFCSFVIIPSRTFMFDACLLKPCALQCDCHAATPDPSASRHVETARSETYCVPDAKMSRNDISKPCCHVTVPLLPDAVLKSTVTALQA